MKRGIAIVAIFVPMIAFGAKYEFECTDKFCVAISDDGKTYYALKLPQYAVLYPQDDDLGLYWFQTNSLRDARPFSPFAVEQAICEIRLRVPPKFAGLEDEAYERFKQYCEERGVAAPKP
jgi:hypothetical protein